MADPFLVRVLRLRRFPVADMLRLEEALLRTASGNWALFNVGAAAPAVVLGLSGQPSELVHVAAARAAGVPLVRRFSGGGTVVVDEGTVFCSLLLSAAAAPAVPCYPRPLMEFATSLFKPAFAYCPDFALRENDYVLGEQKIGGNAQAITRARWLQHTSFLWDFQPERMGLLKQPPKAPEYRAGRHHGEFVVRLKDRLRCKYGLVDDIIEGIEAGGFTTREVELADAAAYLAHEHLQSVRELGPEDGA